MDYHRRARQTSAPSHAVCLGKVKHQMRTPVPIKVGSGETAEGTGEGKCESQAAGGGAVVGEAGSQGRGGGKFLSPEQRCCAVEHARAKYEVSERNACWLLGQWRGTQRYEPIQQIDEDALTGAIIGSMWPANSMN